MYKGLPVITNKIPETERNGIPHHLIDFIGLDEEPWTVGRFVSEAQRVVREIRSRGRLPILVGGTHYYTQALLIKNSLLTDEANGNERSSEQMEKEWPILSAPTEEMYAKLEQLDPVIAGRWHPRDRRHIKRCLEICLQTGRKASAVYQEQEQKRISSGTSKNVESEGEEQPAEPREQLRYPSLIFWLHAEDEVLKARLNARVDTMIAGGLLEEAMEMSNYCHKKTSHGSSLHVDKGIWVSIGYKEMQPYIAFSKSGNCSSGESTRLQNQCLEAVRVATRQYAKRQNRWIRLTLADFLAKASSLDNMFLMDCTNLEHWTEMVSEPSVRITEAFLKCDSLPQPSSLSRLAESVLVSSNQANGKPQFLARKCSICEKVLMSEAEWDRHLRSSGHKKVIQGQKRRLENEHRRQAAAAAARLAAKED